jgi:O-antigen/teichoic acid export membrane protein
MSAITETRLEKRLVKSALWMIWCRGALQAASPDGWSAIVPLLSLMCVRALIRSVAVLFPPVLTARYQASFVFRYNLTMLLVMPIAFFAGASWFGAVGVAGAWVSVYPLVLLWMVQRTLSELDLSQRTFAAELWPPLAGALLVAATMEVAKWALAPVGSEHALARLAIVSLAGAAVYGAGVLALGGMVQEEVRQVVAWLLRGRRSVAAGRQG